MGICQGWGGSVACAIPRCGCDLVVEDGAPPLTPPCRRVAARETVRSADCAASLMRAARSQLLNTAAPTRMAAAASAGKKMYATSFER